MKQLMVGGCVVMALITAMGSARSASSYTPNPRQTPSTEDTCMWGTFYCPDNPGVNEDYANSLSCESACGVTMTRFQAQQTCNGACIHICVDSGATNAC